MGDEIMVHSNTKQKGTKNPALFQCGAARRKNTFVSGDIEKVTCENCLAIYSGDSTETKEDE